MQYLKPEIIENPIMNNVDLMRAAFNCVNEILVLFKSDGTVLETNAVADEYCHNSHQFNVGELLWREKLWLTDWDRKKCQQAFQIVVTEHDTEFVAAVNDGQGNPVPFEFSLKKLEPIKSGERYFLMAGCRKTVVDSGHLSSILE